MGGKALGVVEFKTVASGMTALDRMVKTAAVDIVEAQTVCPGKYIAILSGSLSSVKASVDIARSEFGEPLLGDFVLGNPHEGIFPAIYGAAEIENPGALGILETYDVVSAIVAADVAAKTAAVELIELRLAKGMCGKSYLLLTGEVAAVEAAVQAAKTSIAAGGMFLDSSVIASPDKKMYNTIL